MKNTVLILVISLLSFSAQAQNYTKYQIKRATMFSTYIADKMELNETQQQLVYDVMLARVYDSNAKIKAENITAQADKQAVYSAAYKAAQQKLAADFGAKMARKMMSLSNEARKNADKN